MKTKLTDAIVKQLPTPEKGNRITPDEAVPGFGVRVTAAGARSYILNYRVRGTGQQRRFTIGDAADWSAGAARSEAHRLRREIDQGADPLGDLQDKRAEPTVSQLIDRFIAEHIQPRTRPATAKAYIRLLEKHIRPHFGAHTKVIDVEFEHLDALHQKITRGGASYEANRAMAVASKMFALSIRWRMRETNPCKGVGRNYEVKRKRYLSGDELARLTAVLATYPERQAADIIRMALLTGARVGEIFSMQWADLEEVAERGGKSPRMVWTKAASTTKQKADHIVSLGAPAAQLLVGIREQQTSKHRPLGRFVFPSTLNDTGHIVDISRAWKAMCKTAGITGLRAHDLRHSFASQLVSSGASLPLIGALLGHSSVATTNRYAHLFDDPLRKAVDSVGAVITAAGRADNGDKIESFPKGGRRGR